MKIFKNLKVNGRFSMTLFAIRNRQFVETSALRRFYSSVNNVFENDKLLIFYE